MDEMRLFYENIDMILKSLRITKSELYGALGITRQTLNRWISNGEYGPIYAYFAIRWCLEKNILPTRDSNTARRYNHVVSHLK